MGLARHNPSGHWRLGLSATAASAVLYSAIVLFGVGSASPSALDAGRDPHAAAVLILPRADRSEEHTSELQSRGHLVCRLLLEKKNEEKAIQTCTSNRNSAEQNPASRTAA